MALTLRTDEELDRALTELASAEGASRQEIVRWAVLERYERSAHTARVREGSNRLSHNDAFDLVMGVADGTCDAEQIADRLHVTL